MRQQKHTDHLHSKCANVGYFATDVSATDISARTFRPSKMPKVDVSAKTITMYFLVNRWIDVDVCGGMYVHVFTCMYAGCMPLI